MMNKLKRKEAALAAKIPNNAEYDSIAIKNKCKAIIFGFNNSHMLIGC